MKFIHTADLHLASPLTSKFSSNQARIRKRELFETFERLAKKAVEEEVTAILISGDIFDEENCPPMAKTRFIEIVKKYKQVDFLCLAGNHDESLRNEEGLPENLKTFDDSSWIKYSYGNVDIYGTEGPLSTLYSSLTPREDRVNLVMLHGEVDETGVSDSSKIQIQNLKNKNIDYLALGHIHSYKKADMDFRGVYCYSGCLEGRGYDECGKKGYVLLEIQNNLVESTFVPFSKRTIEKLEVDISNCSTGYEVETKVKECSSTFDKKDLLRVELVGTVDDHIHHFEKDLEETLSDRFFHCSVKNRTKIKLNLEEKRKEISLMGEFIRTVEKDDTLSENEKEQILLYGLRALKNEEVDK